VTETTFVSVSEIVAVIETISTSVVESVDKRGRVVVLVTVSVMVVGTGPTAVTVAGVTAQLHAATYLPHAGHTAEA
jgi:hypothetical protein